MYGILRSTLNIEGVAMMRSNVNHFAWSFDCFLLFYHVRTLIQSVDITVDDQGVVLHCLSLYHAVSCDNTHHEEVSKIFKVNSLEGKHDFKIRN